MRDRQEGNKQHSHVKPSKSEFFEKMKRQMVSYTGLAKVYDRIYTYLDSDPGQIILITGERGVGKELVARAFHKHGDRVNGPFVPVNCGAIPKELIEAELFGAKKGAYTGCVEDRKGRFEEAHSGILFLDEIGDLSPEAQQKLMRVLEYREVVRLGDSQAKAKKVDVKIIAATNKNLLWETERFRPDLYDRVKGFSIDVPPLRERYLDIPVLVRFFIEERNTTTGKTVDSLAFELLYFCICYDWPGNVRELKSFMASCHINCQSGRCLTMEDGRSFFSDQEIPEIEPDIPRGSFWPGPMLRFMGVLFHTENVVRERQELKKLVDFRTISEGKGEHYTEHYEYPEIKLGELPSSRKHFTEMIMCGDVPAPLTSNEEALWQKAKGGEQLAAQEVEYIKWAESPSFESFKKREQDDKKYMKTIEGLKVLYRKNDKSFREEFVEIPSSSQSDLYRLPYKEAKEEFQKEWIKRALIQNRRNKRKTAAEMGITEQRLYQLLRKYKL